MGLLPWSVWVNYSVLQRQDLPNTKCPWITCFYMLSVEGALWPSVSATSSFPASEFPYTCSLISALLHTWGGPLQTCRMLSLPGCSLLSGSLCCELWLALVSLRCQPREASVLCHTALSLHPGPGTPSGQAQGSSFVFRSSGSLPSVLWGLTLENCLFSP